MLKRLLFVIICSSSLLCLSVSADTKDDEIALLKEQVKQLRSENQALKLQLAQADAGSSGIAVEGFSQDKPQTPEKTYDVVITAQADGRKITAIKGVREVTGLGLKDAKDLVDSIPAVVKTGLSKKDAETVAAKLRESSLTVELKEK